MSQLGLNGRYGMKKTKTMNSENFCNLNLTTLFILQIIYIFNYHDNCLESKVLI